MSQEILTNGYHRTSTIGNEKKCYMDTIKASFKVNLSSTLTNVPFSLLNAFERWPALFKRKVT